MNFRTIQQLNQCIIRGMPQIPRDVDLVVGIPRSGMLAASIIALHLNVPLTDLEGLVSGRVFRSGPKRLSGWQVIDPRDCRRILVVDDSVHAGLEMTRARELVEAAGLADRCLYTAIYVSERGRSMVDLWLEVCPRPRVFEWNLLHHNRLSEFCLDMDGVLCSDPTHEQNDDGARYSSFLKQASPLFVPRRPIGWIVTCRLEKYRAATEEWLARYGVEFHNLVMMDLPSAEERRRRGHHASFKAEIYVDSGAILFIESSRSQAANIARLAGKPVIAMEGPELIEPGARASAVGTYKELRRHPRRVIARGFLAGKKRTKALFTRYGGPDYPRPTELR